MMHDKWSPRCILRAHVMSSLKNHLPCLLRRPPLHRSTTAHPSKPDLHGKSFINQHDGKRHPRASPPRLPRPCQPSRLQNLRCLRGLSGDVRAPASLVFRRQLTPIACISESGHDATRYSCAARVPATHVAPRASGPVWCVFVFCAWSTDADSESIVVLRPAHSPSQVTKAVFSLMRTQPGCILSWNVCPLLSNSTARPSVPICSARPIHDSCKPLYLKILPNVFSVFLLYQNDYLLVSTTNTSCVHLLADRSLRAR